LVSASSTNRVSAAASAAPVALVDARNVQRSTWPNIDDEELVRRVRRWAAGRCAVVLVFDGDAPPVDGGPDVELVGSGTESADDRITREAGSLARLGRRFWLVTSDRELRQRAGPGAERTIGGGRFARELLAIPL
jgi:hypothetical protein